MPDQPQPWVSLTSGEFTAEIDPCGAQLSVLRDSASRDLLWNGDAAVWTGRAPLLFPIVGVLANGGYHLGAKTYRLSRHGFARGRMFSIENTSSCAAVFRLTADETSLLVYPFHFELDVHFELQGAKLSVTTWIRNKGDGDMPASFGYHPALRWPLPFGHQRSSHFIQFATDEPAPVRRLDSAGLMTEVRHPTPVVHRRLALTDELFQDDVLIFDQIRSRSIVYGANEGPKIQMSFPDAPYLGVWTKPGAQFICIEPWHGVTDTEGYSGDFRDKVGVFILPGGGALSTTLSIELIDSKPAWE